MHSRWFTSERRPGVLALIAGLILISSGVTSSSILLKALIYVDDYLGSNIGSAGDFVLQLAIVGLAFLVGLGGFLVIAGGALLLGEHGSSGRALVGLGGGTAIFGELFSMGGSLFFSGFFWSVFKNC